MAFDSQANPDELGDCFAIVKSLLIIRNKITTLRDINADYRAMEGEYIPYAKFGYRTLEDFLRASDSFNIMRQATGDTIISARLSQNDEHMAKLIQETRSKSNKPAMKRNLSFNNYAGSGGVRRPFFRPMLANPRPPMYVNRQSAPTFRPPSIHASSSWRPLPPVTMQRPMTQRAPPPTAAATPWTPLPPEVMQRPAPAATKPQITHQAPAATSWTPLPAEVMQRPIGRPEVNLVQPSQESQAPPPRPTGTIPKQRQQPSVGVPEVAAVRTPSTPPPATPTVDLRTLLNSRQQQRTRDGPRFSVKDRLVLTRSQDNTAETTSTDSGVSSASSKHRSAHVPVALDSRLVSESIRTSGDAVADLFAFCEQHNIEAPQLQSYCRKVVGCRLTVQGKSFFEYGNKEAEARNNVAKIALCHLVIQQRRKSYPVAQMNTHELALRLHEVLLVYPQGVIEKNIPELFQEATGTSLPDHWTDVLGAYHRFFCVDTTALAHVVYANEVGDANDSVVAIPLQLPWTLKVWDVFVTLVLSPNMIWARLIGPKYSDLLDKLATAIDAQKPRLQQVADVVVSEVYLVQWMDSCHRVRVSELDEDQKRARCFFIDHGRHEWLATDTLYVCDTLYQVLPGQALPFSLFGLENVEENPHAKNILERNLLQKAVIAKVITRAEDYETGMQIRCVFYDTSGPEDVSLADRILDEICAAGQPPQLNATGPTQVVLTHVSDRGEVFVQVPGSGLDYVQKVIDRLKGQLDLLEHHRGLRQDAGDTPTRYLVCDKANSHWYRATLQVRHPQTKRHVVHCIDTGEQVTVDETDMYHLEPLSKALNSYPAQALRCELHDVPRMDARMVSRVRGLLELGSKALVKAMGPQGKGGHLQVNVWQQLDASTSKVIVCINESLRMEHAFEASI